jgi:hypothetical protein
MKCEDDMTANCETCKHLKGIACAHPELDTMPYEKGCSYWEAVEVKGKDGVMGVCIQWWRLLWVQQAEITYDKRGDGYVMRF